MKSIRAITLARSLSVAAVMLCTLPPSTQPACAAGSAKHHSHASQPSDSRALTTEQIAKLSLPSVVSLTVLDQNGAPAVQGSGFVVGQNLIATNLHVVKGAHAVTANFMNGRSEEVYGIVSVDLEHDLVILYADTTGVHPLALQTDTNAPIGEPVVAVGSPEGLGGSISTGVVSGVRSSGGTKIIQTTAPISHGSSGGALIDPYGRVLGVTSFFLTDGQSLNFAYPSYYVKLLIPKGAPTYTAWALLEDKLKSDWAINIPTDSGAPSNTPNSASPAPPANAASDGAYTEKPLAGLHGVFIIVEDLQDNAVSAGLDSATLKSDVESAMKAANITIFDQNDPDLQTKDPTWAHLYINVNSIKDDDSGLHAYNVDICLKEDVRLTRTSPVTSTAVTWPALGLEGSIGYSPDSDFPASVRHTLKELLDDFTKDYTAQNPPSSQ